MGFERAAVVDGRHSERPLPRDGQIMDKADVHERGIYEYVSIGDDGNERVEEVRIIVPNQRIGYVIGFEGYQRGDVPDYRQYRLDDDYVVWQVITDGDDGPVYDCRWDEIGIEPKRPNFGDEYWPDTCTYLRTISGAPYEQ